MIATWINLIIGTGVIVASLWLHGHGGAEKVTLAGLILGGILINPPGVATAIKAWRESKDQTP